MSFDTNRWSCYRWRHAVNSAKNFLGKIFLIIWVFIGETQLPLYPSWCQITHLTKTGPGLLHTNWGIPELVRTKWGIPDLVCPPHIRGSHRLLCQQTEQGYLLDDREVHKVVDGGGYKGVDYLHLKDYLLNLNIVIVCGKPHHFFGLIIRAFK